jgi:threonine synthase
VYSPSLIQSYCTAAGCATPLYPKYRLLQGLDPLTFLAGAPASMWRYKAFLPVSDDCNIVSLGEGLTPLLQMENLAVPGDVTAVWKDESGNPTGSFKSRGMSTAVSKAKQLGIHHLVTPTAGNAGGALAAYCARAGIGAHVFMPAQTPELFKDEVRFYGASLTEVDGNIADCGRLADLKAEEDGWFSVATLKEPYRLEGKKTMGYEIVEQFNWKLPDVILYPRAAAPAFSASGKPSANWRRSAGSVRNARAWSACNPTAATESRPPFI